MCDELAKCAIITHSASETRAVGVQLGAATQPGDIVCLNGDLGAGKTTFVQGVAVGLGINDREITSPTFALLAEHLGGRIPLYHVDVYRLRDGSQLYDLGFDDYLRNLDGLIIIEWAERVADDIPTDRLDIIFSPGTEDDDRTLVLTAHGYASKNLLTLLSR